MKTCRFSRNRGAPLRGLFARLGNFGALGLKLDVGDQLSVPSFGVLHFVTANLGLVVLAGESR